MRAQTDLLRSGSYRDPRGDMREEVRLQQLTDAFARDLPALTIELGRFVLAERPDLAVAHAMVGQAYTSVARYAVAAIALERNLELCEEDSRARALNSLGHLSREKGDFDTAESFYRRSIENAPHKTAGYIFLGAMLAKNGRLEEAEEIHRQATQCSEGDFDEAYLNLGLVLRGKGEYLKSLEALRQSLALDPLDRDTQEAILDIESVLFEFPST